MKLAVKDPPKNYIEWNDIDYRDNTNVLRQPFDLDGERPSIPALLSWSGVLLPLQSVSWRFFSLESVMANEGNGHPYVHFVEPRGEHDEPHRKLESPPPPPEAERLTPKMGAAKQAVEAVLDEDEDRVQDGHRVHFTLSPDINKQESPSCPLSTFAENVHGHHHVHFSGPVGEDTLDHEQHRKLDSPPPPPEAGSLSPMLNPAARKVVDFFPIENTEVFNSEDGPHVHFSSPRWEEPKHGEPVILETDKLGDHHHVHFSRPQGDDTLDHDGLHRRLESPPPPPEAGNLSPKLGGAKKVVETRQPISGGEDHELTMQVPSTPATSAITSSSRCGSVASTGTPKFASKDLRGNMTRRQINRDPLQFYELDAVLGVGSMGSVAKVRKRQSALGVKARLIVQERSKKEKKIKACFNLPIVGGLFQCCLKGQAEAWIDNEMSRDINNDTATSSAHGTESSVSTEGVYAMKSIHLSRCTDVAFIEELKNEIEILKTLDHPHIVRAIETFEHRNQLFVIMELCSGGDLYSHDPYTEEEAARITAAIIGAVSYMHSRGM